MSCSGIPVLCLWCSLKDIFYLSCCIYCIFVLIFSITSSTVPEVGNNVKLCWACDKNLKKLSNIVQHIRVEKSPLTVICEWLLSGRWDFKWDISVCVCVGYNLCVCVHNAGSCASTLARRKSETNGATTSGLLRWTWWSPDTITTVCWERDNNVYIWVKSWKSWKCYSLIQCVFKNNKLSVWQKFT